MVLARRLREHAFAVCLLVLAACAPRHVPPPRTDPIAQSFAAMRAGCYRCLEEGLEAVEAATGVAARERTFELALLLALRAKELGLPFEPWRQRAASVAASLPPQWQTQEFLALVDAMPLDTAGFDRDQTFRVLISARCGAGSKQSGGRR